MTKYKLRISIKFQKSSKIMKTITRAFIWEKKEDALSCKELLEKCEMAKGVTFEFVEFTEEINLS